jgi:hypothetical protein
MTLQDAIIYLMKVPLRQPIKTGSGADLAFAVVVLVSFFSITSSLKSTSLLEIGLLVGSGITYILVGIYGYAFVARTESLSLHLIYFAVQALLGGAIVYLGRATTFTPLILLPLVGHTIMLLPTGWAYAANAVLTVTFIAATGLSSASACRDFWRGRYSSSSLPRWR